MKITLGNQRRNNCVIRTPNRTVSISSDHYFRLYVAFFEKNADIQRKGRFSQYRRHHWWRWRRQADLMLGYSVVGWHPLRRWNNTWLSASFSWNPAARVNEISLYSWLNSFPMIFFNNQERLHSVWNCVRVCKKYLFHPYFFNKISYSIKRKPLDLRPLYIRRSSNIRPCGSVTYCSVT